jgi:hypothetical protein
VILHSNLKQSCDLGENNHDLRIIVKGTENFPQPFGRYARCAFTDVGWTHEDGCLVSKSFARRLSTVNSRSQTFASDGEYPSPLVEPGDYVWPGREIVSISDEILLSNCSSLGKVCAVQMYEDFWEGSPVRCLAVHTEHVHDCKPGTKLAGLHGNKVTVSEIMEDRDMFQTSTGEVCDIVMSPYSIAKRNSPSVFMEAAMIEILDHLGMESMMVDRTISLRDMVRWTEGLGLERCKRRLWFMGNGCRRETLVGKVFLMVLDHHPADKIRIGDTIKYDHRGLPRRGVGEGRLTREEVEVLVAHNCKGLVEELLATKQRSNLPFHTREYLRVFGLEWRNE